MHSKFKSYKFSLFINSLKNDLKYNILNDSQIDYQLLEEHIKNLDNDNNLVINESSQMIEIPLPEIVENEIVDNMENYKNEIEDNRDNDNEGRITEDYIDLNINDEVNKALEKIAIVSEEEISKFLRFSKRK